MLAVSGQSMNSDLIENLFGELHAHVDMNIFFMQEELRKQAGVMAGKFRDSRSFPRSCSDVFCFRCDRLSRLGEVIFNGTGKPALRPGDARLVQEGCERRAGPLQVAVRNLHQNGESHSVETVINEPMSFRSVPDCSFNSILLKCLVIVFEGRFVAEEALKSSSFLQGVQPGADQVLPNRNRPSFLSRIQGCGSAKASEAVRR